MGFLGLFGGGKKKTKVDKLVKKVTNAYVQPQERQRFMYTLAEMGTEESLLGLLQRFTFHTEGSIVDEEEKALAYQLLVNAGPSAIQPIKTYVTSRDSVYWPLKAMRELAGMDAAVDLLLMVLDRVQDSEARVNDHKIQLVSNLRDFPHPRVEARLRDLCTDGDEEVRLMAMDGLMSYGEREALESVMSRLLDPEETARVRTVIYEQLVDHGWSLNPWRAQLEEADVIPPHYRLGPGGALIRSQ